jgi:hypothetical protein
MTHLVGVRIRNWMRYRGEHEIQLGPGCYGIVAEDQQDARRSNALGKSSFLAAIRYALEGVRVEEVDQLDELISRGEDSYSTELEFSTGMFVSREKKRNASANLYLEIDGRKLRGEEAQEEIDRQLGLSPADRLTTCWSEQGDLPALVRATPGNLTKMVERWLELERLAAAGDSVTSKLAERSAELTSALSEVRRLEADADEERIAALEARIAELEALKLEHARSVEVATVEIQNFQLRRRLFDLVTERDQAVADLKSSKLELKAGEVEPPQDLAALEEVRAVARRAAEERSAEVSKLSVLISRNFDGACPVSPGFRCPATEAINLRTHQNKLALDAAKYRHAEAALESNRALDLLNRAREKERARQAAAVEAARLEESIRLRRQTIERLAEEIETLIRKGIQPAAPDAEPPPYPPEFDFRVLLMAAQELRERKSARIGLQEARQSVARLKVEARVSRLASGVLGPEGARRRVAERSVQTIEQIANRKLAEAGIGLTVRAAWGRETGQLAEQCPNCGSAFPSSARVKQCERCGTARGPKVRHEFRWRLSARSGAMKDLAGLALRCAGFEWLRSVRGAAWSVMILDEVTGQLDRAHRVAVSAGIRRLLVGTCEQAFCTAHESGTLAACDRTILIKGSGDWSSLTVAA